MSATLTWASSGNGTKTGTTINTFLDDLDTLITSKAGDATFFWQKAGKSSVSTPFYLLLSPKDGSNRRIAILSWGSAPAANNAAILDQTPGTGIYIVYFPNGSANTLSNLTAASGTICGNDTGVVKCAYFNTVAAAYGASFVPYYFDCAEGMIFLTGNPANATVAAMGAGSLLVDGSDVAYDCAFGTGGATFVPGSGSSSPWSWTVTANLAGGSTGSIKTNYGSSNRNYYTGWIANGGWGTTLVGSTDILTDTSNTKAWFVPIQLLGITKGEGFVLKLRQIAIGPNVVGALTVYNTTGPVVAARSMTNTTIGTTTGFGWVTNFKL